MNVAKVWMAVFLALAIAWPAAARDEDSSDSTTYPVDQGQVFAPPVPGAPIVVRMFSTDKTNFGTGAREDKEKAHDVAEHMRATAPPALAQSIVNQLRQEGSFPSVSLAQEGGTPPGSMVLDGEFTTLNPGSRGKRFWIGMGAGRSLVCVKGHVEDPAGRRLVAFEHCRSGNLGWFGGRAEGMMFTDVAGTAEKVSEFLDGWARGAYSR